MDSLTHVFLGGCVGQLLGARALGRWAWIVGALAASFPDLDVFIHTGDPVLDHAMHRHFMHALVLVPILGVLSALPFAAHRRLHAHWRSLLLIGILACATHTLLDACTSYGTMLLWPFSDARTSWDLLPVVDPLFTLPLVVAMVWAARRRTARPAAIGLALAALYVCFALVQHGRALEVQRQFAALRGHQAIRGRVLPLLGTTIAYRSLYEHDGRLYADAIRVPPGRAPRVLAGTSIPRELPPPDAPPALRRDLALFDHFADGFVARAPGRPEVLADMRYSLVPEGFAPLWGARLSPDAPPAWVSLRGLRGELGPLWRQIVGRGPYQTLGALHPGR